MVIFSSQYTKAAALSNVTRVNIQNNNNTKCNTKHKFNLKSLRSHTTLCTENGHMVILRHSIAHTTVCAVGNTTD
jgi:hypothetical protein